MQLAGMQCKTYKQTVLARRSWPPEFAVYEKINRFSESNQL